MAGFFVVPEDDETLHSLLARYCTYTHYDNGNAVNVKFFGKRNLPTKLDLPSNLGELIRNIEDVSLLTSTEIIEKHSSWPYYRGFVSPSRRAMILDFMVKGNGNIYAAAGINASKMIRNNASKYCPQCYVEDIERAGFAYWHRSHQLPEIQICAIHQCYLIDCPTTDKSISRTSYIDLNEFDHVPRSQVQCQEVLIVELAEIMVNILRSKFSFDIDQIDYLELLKKSKYFRIQSLDSKAFVRDFENYYAPLGKSKLVESAPKWLPIIARRPSHYFHPLKHIMLYKFALDLDEKINVLNNRPFGEGPWKCINPAAEHFNTYVISKLELHTDTKSKRLIGVFICSCEMEYTKSISLDGGIKSDVPKIRKWGSVWIKTLATKLSEGMSYRSIAKLLGTDASTVSKYAQVETELVEDDSKLDAKKSELRERWIKALNKFSVNRIVQARKMCPEIYAWLYRNDREWLLVNNKMSPKRNDNSQLRLDWVEIDASFSKRILEVAARLKADNFKGRISKNVIINSIKGQSYIVEKNLNKLPKSFSRIEDEAETKEDYSKRRIDFALQKLLADKTYPLRWKVMRKAGITKRASDEVLKYLDKVIRIAS